MKVLKKKSELIKRWLLVIFASTFMIISAVLFALSFEVYDDGFGTDISFDMDMMVCLICGVSLLVYSIYSIISLKKNISMHYVYYGSFSVISILTTFYPLGVFFKAIAKGKPYQSNQEYLYIGILGLIMLLYLIFSYLSDLEKKA